MLQQFKSYIDTMTGVIKKDDVLKYTEQTITNIAEEVIPALEVFIKDTDPVLLENSEILNRFRRSRKFKYKSNRAAIDAILDTCSTIVKEERSLKKVIDKHLSDVIIPKTAIARDVSILVFVTGIASIATYVPDLLYYILVADDEDVPMSRAKVDSINFGGASFISHIEYYSTGYTKRVKALSKVSGKVITSDNDMLSSVLANTGIVIKPPIANGFLANPVYHIGMWWVDRGIKQYEANIEKKKLLELKLLEIKLRANGDSNASTAKQIEYYEDKIARLEEDIAEYQED